MIFYGKTSRTKVVLNLEWCLMKGHYFLFAIFAAIVVLLSGTTLAQTDININNQNLIRMGGDVTVPEKQTVENAIAIGGNTIVQPGARVTQTAIAVGGNVTLRQNARVDGDVYSVGGRIIQESGASIGGASASTDENNPTMRGWRHRAGLAGYWVTVASRMATALVAAAIGALLLLWQPNFLVSIANLVNQAPGKSALWGFLGGIALVVINVILAITIIGLPLIPIVTVAAMVIAFLGALGVALLVGQRVMKSSQRTPVQQFLIGLLIVTVIGLIPVIGGIVLFIANLLGFGAILAWKLGNARPQPAG
jgi:hypothetical protein